MADDTQTPSLTNQAGPGGAPVGYASPQQIQQAYMAMLSKGKQQSTQPIRSWTQVAAGIMDTMADQMLINRMTGGQQAGMKSAAEALAGLGGGEDVSPGPDGVPPQAGQPQAGADHNGDLLGFIRQHEGFNPAPYADGKQTSIGYGTRAQPGEASITRDEAESRLNNEVGKAAAFVETAAPHAPNPVKHALTDLTYNAGGKWAKSGLGDAVEKGDWQTAKQHFLQYNHADGKFSQGLANRRVAMAGMFDQAGDAGQGAVPGGAMAFNGQLSAPGGAPVVPQPPAAAAPPTMNGAIQGVLGGQGKPPAGQPPGQPNVWSPGQQGQQPFIDPRFLKPQIPQQAAIKALSNPYLPPDERKMIIDQILQAKQPYELPDPSGVGTVRVDPRSGSQMRVPGIEKGIEKLPGGIERPFMGTVTPQGISKLPITSPQGAQPPSGAPAVNELPENATPGQAQEFVRKGAVLQKGQEEQQTADIKKYEGLHTGITGAAQNASEQTKNLAELQRIAPDVYSGTGANALLGLNRLSARFGIDPKGAAPREQFNQLAARVLADQFAGIRNLTNEETAGAGGSRIFSSMLDIEEKANITHEDTLEGVQRKLKLLEQGGNMAKRWGDMADDYKKEHGRLDPGFMKMLRKDIAEQRYEDISPKSKETETKSEVKPQTEQPSGTPRVRRYNPSTGKIE